MTVLRSQVNGLKIGLASDTVGVVRNFAIGENNAHLFGGMKKSDYDKAVKNDKPVVISTDFKPEEVPLPEDKKEMAMKATQVHIIDDIAEKKAKKGKSRAAAVVEEIENLPDNVDLV